MEDIENNNQPGTIDGRFVMVFKTDIEKEADLEKVMAILNGLPGILRWNINRDDKDKVLRIESGSNMTVDIIKVISENGFHCEELPD
jgi:hypothetical protein